MATTRKLDLAERQARIDLAAAFRLTARFGWHEAVANHFSLALDPDGRHILINPRWRHFARIRASDLLLLDVDDPGVMQRPDAPDPTAWCIHAALHRLRPEIRCVLHTHMPYATTLTSLEDSRVLPIDQNSARFWGRIAYDDAYGGFALASDEGERMAAALGDKPILFLAEPWRDRHRPLRRPRVRRALLSGEGLPASGPGLLHRPAAAPDLRQSRGCGRERLAGL